MKTWFPILLLFGFYQANAMCVKGDFVNLREKPSTKSKISWVVGKYTPLKFVKREGAWLNVKDVDGKPHWIHRKLVSQGMKCVSVKVKKANLRKGPGTNFGPTEIVYTRKYATFRKLDRDDAWLKLKDDYGNIHWAHESTVWEPLYYSRATF